MHQARGARGAGLSLRHAKRYLITDSPLTAISWWRLLLDEAQNVGDGFSQVALLSTTLLANPAALVSNGSALRSISYVCINVCFG